MKVFARLGILFNKICKKEVIAKKIAVTEIKRTPKAILVEKDGKQAWVQNRSFKDGTVEEKVFNKGVEWLESKKEYDKLEKERKNSWVTLDKEVETEKAFGARFWIDFCDLEKDRKEVVWFPKSQANPANGNQFKGWLVDKKIEEVKDKYPFTKYGGIFVFPNDESWQDWNH